MQQRLLKLCWLPSAAIAILLAVTACGDQGPLPSEPALSPESAHFAKGGNGKALGLGKDKAPKARGKRKDGVLGEWSLAVGKLDRKGELKDEALVDGTEDVLISAAGHYLRIPKGTVSEETWFRIRQEHQTLEDGSTVVAVDLKATRVDPATGEEVNVGALGFGTDDSGQPRRVYLYMTSEWSTNRPAGALTTENATILWLKSLYADQELVNLGDDSTVVHVAEEVAGVTVHQSFVVAALEHFSRYALAFP